MANRRSGVKKTPDLRLVLCLLSLAGAATAAQQPVFKATTELVRIPVSITRGNTPVEPGTLTAYDFTLTEDGVPQTVSLFQRESLRLSVAVVYDISSSMGEDRPAQFGVYALRQIAMRLRAEDEVAFIAFAGAPIVRVPWTPASEATKLSLDLRAKGMTSLVDAVLAGLQLLDNAKNPRPVVLVVSDGLENSSRASLSELVTTRRQSEAAVYAFTIAPLLGAPPSTGVNVIPGLVGNSGGVEYRVVTGLEAPTLAQAFVDDLRFQYTLGYTPLKPFDGQYRRVKVELKKRGYRLRHRGGYLALPAG